MTLSDLRMWRENGHAEGVAKIAASVRERVFDLPAFTKELELRMTPGIARPWSRRSRHLTRIWKANFVLAMGGAILRCS